jgi:membrane-associated phospholipid phosphatase
VKREPFLAWPGWANLRITVPLCLSFLKLFSSVYGSTSLLAAVRSPHPGPYFPFELHLPFVPSMAAAYLTVPLALLLTPFILRTWRDLTPLFLTLTAETLVAGLCFLLLPFAQAYPPRIASGFWGGIFRFADAVNLDYNEVPSLNVTFAVTLALVFGRRRGPLGRFLFLAWAVTVCVSTLLIHEHHLLDVGAGIVLGVAAVLTVQRPASREPVLDALRIEALCLREVWFFTRRHPRYLLTALALWVHGLPRWRATRLLRASWCLAQQVDDVLDGDRKVKGDPEAYVERLIRGMTEGTPAGDEPEAILAAYVWDGLGRLETRAGTGADDPRGDLLALFARLRLDRRRMDAKEIWSAAALAEQHRETFDRSLNLALILDGAELRAADVPELVEALAWCSPVRDLEKDLAKGLINIPAEVLEPLTPRPPLPSPPADRERGRGTIAAPAVQAWLAEEHRRGAAAIAALGRKLPGVRDRRSREILAAFHRALASYERKYRRRHRDMTPGGEGLLAGSDPAC